MNCYEPEAKPRADMLRAGGNFAVQGADEDQEYRQQGKYQAGLGLGHLHALGHHGHAPEHDKDDEREHADVVDEVSLPGHRGAEYRFQAGRDAGGLRVGWFLLRGNNPQLLW